MQDIDECGKGGRAGVQLQWSALAQRAAGHNKQHMRTPADALTHIKGMPAGTGVHTGGCSRQGQSKTRPAAGWLQQWQGSVQAVGAMCRLHLSEADTCKMNRRMDCANQSYLVAVIRDDQHALAAGGQLPALCRVADAVHPGCVVIRHQH